MEAKRQGLAMMLAVAVGAGSVGLAADITVVKEGAGKALIDVSAFAASGGRHAAACREIMREDLLRSGWFLASPPGRGAIVVRGTCGTGRRGLTAEVSVENTGTGRAYLNERFSEGTGDVRRLAHRVADAIVEAVHGRPGIASTRIVMIGSRKGQKDVYVCDADGGNLVRVTSDGAVCLAPEWGPKADRFVYTSFHRGFPDVYEVNLESNRRDRLAGFPGLNAGARISPDGRQLALALSKDGNPDLYVMDLRRGTLSRITQSRHAAEASPAWSQDGTRLVFVSDRSGSPQLYVADRSGAEKRITFRGSENVSPDWGSDGRIVWSSRREGKYHLCVMDPDRGNEEQLTHDFVDHEDPSWAPDQRHIVYTRTERYQSDLYILDTLGDPPIRLSQWEGAWHSAAWSPR